MAPLLSTNPQTSLADAPPAPPLVTAVHMTSASSLSSSSSTIGSSSGMSRSSSHKELSKMLPPRSRTSSVDTATSSSSPPSPRIAKAHSSAPRPQSSKLAQQSAAQLEQTLQRAQKHYGKHHAKIGPLWNLLGNAHFRTQHYTEAVQAYKQAITCPQSAVNPHWAAAFGNLGTVYWTIGQVDEAKECLEQALETYQLDLVAKQTTSSSPRSSNRKSVSTTQADSTMQVANTLHQLGLCHALCKDTPKALESLAAARQIRERLEGPQHVSVARTLDAMGKVYLLDRDFDTAYQCHAQALTIYQLQPAGAVLPIATYQNLAAVHAAQQDYMGVVECLYSVVKLQKTKANSSSNGNNPEAARAVYETLLQMSHAFGQAGLEADATACHKEALAWAASKGLEVDATR